MGAFTSALDEGIVASGNVAVACQSGAYAGHLAYLCRLRNVGVSYWVSTGNEADTDVAACIEWLAQQDDVGVIMAYACSRGVYPAECRLGIITVSGGFGTQTCDAASRCGLDVSPLPAAAQAKLHAINPMGGASNPCDTTAGWLNDTSIITRTFEVMYEEGGYDSLIGSFTMLPNSPTYGDGIRQAIAAGTGAHMDRPTVLCMAASPDVVRSYDEAGFLVFSDSERAAQAVAALAWLQEGFERPLPTRGATGGALTAVGTASYRKQRPSLASRR